MERVLLYFTLKYNGKWDDIYNALKKKEKINHKQLENIENKINCKYITILHPHYPRVLKYAKKPPFVIFYKGNTNLFNKFSKTLAFVGLENLKSNEINNFKDIIKDFYNEKVVFLFYQDTIDNNNFINYCNEKNYSSIHIIKEDMNKFLSEKKYKCNYKNTLLISELYYCDKSFDEYKENCLNRFISALSKAIFFPNFKTFFNFLDLYLLLSKQKKTTYIMEENINLLNDAYNLTKLNIKILKNKKDLLNNL